MAQPHPKLDQLKALGQRKLKERAGRAAYGSSPATPAIMALKAAQDDAIARSIKSAERATEKRAARRAKR